MSVNDQRVNRRQNFERFNRLTEWPMVSLALILVPILIIENEAVDPTLLTVAYTLNWIIWLAFCAEYFTKLILAPQRLKFIRIAWLDLVIILLSPPFLPTLFESTRTLRLLRVLRLLRILAVAGLGLRLLRKLLGRHQFHYLGSIAVGLVVLCGVSVYFLERNENPSIETFGDALWWAIVTATTVGYGDVSPVTLEGRVIAVILMMSGIGVIGAFTATIASLFLEDDGSKERANLDHRLGMIEAKLDRLVVEISKNNSKLSDLR